jgi:hypothetical protein
MSNKFAQPDQAIPKYRRVRKIYANWLPQRHTGSRGLAGTMHDVRIVRTTRHGHTSKGDQHSSAMAEHYGWMKRRGIFPEKAVRSRRRAQSAVSVAEPRNSRTGTREGRASHLSELPSGSITTKVPFGVYPDLVLPLTARSPQLQTTKYSRLWRQLESEGRVFAFRLPPPTAI